MYGQVEWGAPYRQQHFPGQLQTSVVVVVALWQEAHRRAIRPARLRQRLVSLVWQFMHAELVRHVRFMDWGRTGADTGE